MLDQEGREPCPPPGGGIPGDAGVDDAVGQTQLPEALLQKPNPALPRVQAIARAQTIAEYQDDRGRGRGGRLLAQGQGGQPQTN